MHQSLESANRKHQTAPLVFDSDSSSRSAAAAVLSSLSLIISFITAISRLLSMPNYYDHATGAGQRQLPVSDWHFFVLDATIPWIQCTLWSAQNHQIVSLIYEPDARLSALIIGHDVVGCGAGSPIRWTSICTNNNMHGICIALSHSARMC